MPTHYKEISPRSGANELIELAWMAGLEREQIKRKGFEREVRLREESARATCLNINRKPFFW